MNILKWLWTPYSVLHLLLSYLFYGVDRAYWFEGRRVLLVQNVGVGFSSTIGQAVGMSIAIDRAYAREPRIFAHEMQHTRQALLWGPLWPAVYFGAILYERFKRPSWQAAYYYSRYERLAREAADGR